MTSRMVIDATGRSSSIAKRLGVGRKVFDSLCGVAAIIERSTMLQTLCVESAEYGWWYSNAFSAEKAVVCLMSDTDLLQSAGAIRAENWVSLFARTQLAAKVILPPSLRLRVFPCESSISSEIAGNGWLALGDAASVLDPLASSGVIKAFCDARAAADAIETFLQDGQTNSLDDYSASRSHQFQRYMLQRRAQYRLEPRWKSASFWKRRMN